MTSTNRFSASPAHFSPEMTSFGASRLSQAEKGRPCADKQGSGPSAFAAHVELLLKEERPGRKAAGPISSSSDDTPASRADGDLSAGATDATAAARAEEASLPSEDRDDGARSAPDDTAVGRDATLDPMLQVLGALAPRAAPSTMRAKPELAAQPDVRTPVEQLMARLVRRVAWSGNGRTGAARLELGAGELEGATLIIQADEGVVRVALDLPPGVDRAAWKKRISGRLAMRGIQVETVDVG